MPRRPLHVPRVIAIATALALTAAVVVVAPMRAAAAVECGQLSAYTPPDPATPTDGSLTIGFLEPWTVAANATISPDVSANLLGLVTSSPVCLDIVTDDGDGTITSIGFAPGGTVSGPVTFQTAEDFDFYVLADRLLIPDFVIDTYPGLAALFVASFQAGVSPTLVLTTDGATGVLVGIDGTTAFCGIGGVNDDGAGLIGAAVLPPAVLDAEDLAALAGAADAEACADVHVQGTSGQAGLDLTTDVVITVAVPPTPEPTDEPTTAPGGGATAGPALTPPPTDGTSAVAPSRGNESFAGLLLVLAALTTGLLALVRRPATRLGRITDERRA